MLTRQYRHFVFQSEIICANSAMCKFFCISINKLTSVLLTADEGEHSLPSSVWLSFFFSNPSIISSVAGGGAWSLIEVYIKI